MEIFENVARRCTPPFVNNKSFSVILNFVIAVLRNQ